MFTDKRSKRVILVAHCILNQNAKIDRCAHYPGVMSELTEALIASDLGLVQMPCPEFLILGLDRLADPANLGTIEAEDTRVAQRMQAERSRRVCRELATGLIYQVEQYRKHGFTVCGLLGINGSPTCGVESNWNEGIEADGPGVLINEMLHLLEWKGIQLKMRGVKASQPKDALATLEELLRNNTNLSQPSPKGKG